MLAPFAKAASPAAKTTASLAASDSWFRCDARPRLRRAGLVRQMGLIVTGLIVTVTVTVHLIGALNSISALSLKSEIPKL